MVLGIHRVSVYFYDAFYKIRLIQNADTFSGLPVLLKHFQQAADFEGDLFFILVVVKHWKNHMHNNVIYAICQNEFYCGHFLGKNSNSTNQIHEFEFEDGYDDSMKMAVIPFACVYEFSFSCKKKYFVFPNVVYMYAIIVERLCMQGQFFVFKIFMSIFRYNRSISILDKEKIDRYRYCKNTVDIQPYSSRFQ